MVTEFVFEKSWPWSASWPWSTHVARRAVNTQAAVCASRVFMAGVVLIAQHGDLAMRENWTDSWQLNLAVRRCRASATRGQLFAGVIKEFAHPPLVLAGC